jgi:predicted nuclease of predicted toxin-antitoxin system
MKFLVDAQLPRRLAIWLRDHGYDALHTLDLPAGNRTTDAELLAVAAREQRAVITKDDDFVRTFLVRGEPETLLLVATGNIGNRALEQLMQTHWLQIETSLQKHRFVELLRERLVVHD